MRNRPILPEGLDFVLNAFFELRSDRPVGMTVGAIPWSSIDRWAQRHHITNMEDFDTFISQIRAMEEALSEKESKKGHKK